MALTAARTAIVYGPAVPYSGGRRGVDGARIDLVASPWGKRVACHELVAAHWSATAQRAAAEVPEFTPGRIDSFNPREIRGVERLSQHAWALAWDAFKTPLPSPPPGGVWTPPEMATPEANAWLDVWKREGFRLGRDYTGRVDLPHFEWVDEPPPAPPAPAPVPEEDLVIVHWIQGDGTGGPLTLPGSECWIVSHADSGAVWLVARNGAVYALGKAEYQAVIDAGGSPEGLQPHVANLSTQVSGASPFGADGFHVDVPVAGVPGFSVPFTVHTNGDALRVCQQALAAAQAKIAQAIVDLQG